MNPIQHNDELSRAADSPMAEPPDRSADGPHSIQRRTPGDGSNDMLYGSRYASLSRLNTKHLYVLQPCVRRHVAAVVFREEPRGHPSDAKQMGFYFLQTE
jgi:hypothetical protein